MGDMKNNRRPKEETSAIGLHGAASYATTVLVPLIMVCACLLFVYKRHQDKMKSEVGDYNRFDQGYRQSISPSLEGSKLQSPFDSTEVDRSDFRSGYTAPN